MNFNIELDEKRCETKNGDACPLRSFYNGEDVTCQFFEKSLELGFVKDLVWLRCPECLAEEKKQKDSVRRCSVCGSSDCNLYSCEDCGRLFCENCNDRVKDGFTCNCVNGDDK
jgi:hypothetical protein